jgi:NitT/TauT family transport system substrate-binding protein
MTASSFAWKAALALALVLSACGVGGAPAGAPSSAASIGAPTAAAKPASSAPSAAASTKPVAGGSAAASAAASAAPSAQAGGPAPTPGSTPIRLGLLPSGASAPIYTNLETGAYANSGLDVSITPFTDTVQIMVSIASGQLDMGQITLGSGALNAFARGTDLKMLASANQDPPEHGALTPVLVRTDLMDSGQVKSFKDLKGRKVSINGKGTILEYTVGKLSLAAGFQPSDIDLVILPVPDQVTALGNKAIDAALPLQPIATQAVQKGVAKVLTDTVSPNAQLGTITANARWAEAHKDAVIAFLLNQVKMVRQLAGGKYKTNQAALAAIQKWTKTDPEVIKAAPDLNWPQDLRLNRQSLADEQQYFVDQKAVNYSQPIPIDSLIDESYLESALKQVGG